TNIELWRTRGSNPEYPAKQTGTAFPPMTQDSSPLPVFVSGDITGAVYGRFSVPLNRGSWFEIPALALRNREGVCVPIQVSILGKWPDGCIRVLHVIAPMSRGTYQVEIGVGGADCSGTQQVAVRHENGGGLFVHNCGDLVKVGGGVLLGGVA